MATKHTHRGHCQLCDRLQAVNTATGKLAKHGYSKQWGYFQGTCPGSDHLPYEHDKALIPPVITRVAASIRQYACDIADTELLAITRPFWGAVTLQATQERDAAGRRKTREAMGTFSIEAQEEHDTYTYVRCRWVPDEPVVFAGQPPITGLDHGELYRTNQYYGCSGPEDYGSKWREREVGALQMHKQHNESYRAWLLERLDKWRRCDLVPVAKVA